MKDAWNEHVQPVLDSWRWDNFSWVWDPFFYHYPRFGIEQRTAVEDALVTSAFNIGDDDIAVKALVIAEELHRAQLATPRLSQLMRDALLRHVQTLGPGQETAHYYIFACSTFQLKAAAPFIRSIMASLERTSTQDPLEETKEWYPALLRACCLSLLFLGEEDGGALLTPMIRYELRMKAGSRSGYDGWTATDLANFWDRIGLNGLQKLAAALHTLNKEELPAASELLSKAALSIRYRTRGEERRVRDIIEELQRSGS
jgi:hypothetical protein